MEVEEEVVEEVGEYKQVEEALKDGKHQYCLRHIDLLFVEFLHDFYLALQNHCTLVEFVVVYKQVEEVAAVVGEAVEYKQVEDYKQIRNNRLQTDLHNNRH